MEEVAFKSKPVVLSALDGVSEPKPESALSRLRNQTQLLIAGSGKLSTTTEAASGPALIAGPDIDAAKFLPREERERSPDADFQWDLAVEPYAQDRDEEALRQFLDPFVNFDVTTSLVRPEVDYIATRSIESDNHLYARYLDVEDLGQALLEVSFAAAGTGKLPGVTVDNLATSKEIYEQYCQVLLT